MTIWESEFVMELQKLKIFKKPSQEQLDQGDVGQGCGLL